VTEPWVRARGEGVRRGSAALTFMFS
jgi:hypothetical protein